MRQNSPGDSAILEARLLDAARLCFRRSQPIFVGSLSKAEAFSAQGVLRREGFFHYLFRGGFEGVERVMLGAFPDYLEPESESFPTCAVAATFHDCDKLTHRDFLGALMALGIIRDTVDDLLIEPGQGVLFLREEMTGYIRTQVEKIGRVGVRLTPGSTEPLSGGPGFEPFSTVIASPRLDCVVVVVLRISREKAARLVESGGVLLGGVQIMSVSTAVKDGDRSSVHGKGWLILDQIGPGTKRGRVSLSGRKYK